HERYFAALRGERFLAADEAATDPRTAEFRQEYLEPLAIRSMLDAPVRSRGEVVAVLCCEQVGRPRHWTEDEKIFAGAVSDIVSTIIESETRRLMELEADESRERVRRLLETTPLAAIQWDRRMKIR